MGVDGSQFLSGMMKILLELTRDRLQNSIADVLNATESLTSTCLISYYVNRICTPEGQRVLSAVLSFPGMGLGEPGYWASRWFSQWQLAFISVQTRRRKITIQCPYQSLGSSWHHFPVRCPWRKNSGQRGARKSSLCKITDTEVSKAGVEGPLETLILLLRLGKRQGQAPGTHSPLCQSP